MPDDKLERTVRSMADFFGCSLREVDSINLHIAVMANHPEWLRGVPSVVDLPRREIGIRTNEMAVPASVGELSGRIIWIIESLRGPWDFKIWSKSIFFADDTDAVAYNLVWD